MINIIQDSTEYDEPDDGTIMQQARHNPRAFAPLYERYAERIYAYCLRRVSNQADAEDLTSLIFTRAISHLQDYRGGSVGAWLFRIASNTVKNYYRSTRSTVSLDDNDFPLTDHGPSPMEQMLQTEREETLNRAVEHLTEEQRNLLALKIAGGLTSQDIGEVVGKSPGAVRVEIHRILKQLRTLYHHEEGQS